MEYMTISHNFNSYGKCTTIKVDGYKSTMYVGYSKRAAEQLYRKQHNLQGKRFVKIEV